MEETAIKFYTYRRYSSFKHIDNEEKCKNYIENSLAMCTSLAPIIGYDKTAEISKKAHKTGKTIRQICLEDNILDDNKLNEILNPYNMIQSNVKDKK